MLRQILHIKQSGFGETRDMRVHAERLCVSRRSNAGYRPAAGHDAARFLDASQR